MGLKPTDYLPASFDHFPKNYLENISQNNKQESLRCATDRLTDRLTKCVFSRLVVYPFAALFFILIVSFLYPIFFI